MKRILLIFIVALWPRLAAAQSYVNPDTIYQSGDIYLQNTDVYYNPFAPPSDSDTRANLCNISDILRDPDGVGWGPIYRPMIYDTTVIPHHFDSLFNWAPHGQKLGKYVVWQRLFTARRKQDGTPSNIIAGSNVNPDTSRSHGKWGVIISKNEDVDFRASGRIELKSGFHVKPGAFFHAYTEPKWDTTVFSDEFDDAAKTDSQWYVGKGWGDVNGGAQCSSDSNVFLDTDYEAHDGLALDIVIREDTGGCFCDSLIYSDSDNCNGRIASPFTIKEHILSSANLVSCPYPYSSKGKPLGRETYAHAPYGKYEIRDKIPHVLHHTNNWGVGGMEWDLNETQNNVMGIVNPNWSHPFRFGPCTGKFQKRGTPYNDTIFISSDAGWCDQNLANSIIINNIDYLVSNYNPATNRYLLKDTVSARDETKDQGGFPASLLADSINPVQFYYHRIPSCSSDSETWTVDSTGRIFSAAYKDSSGHLHLFSKDYQPTQLTLTGYDTTGIIEIKKTHACHWRASLNTSTNLGLIWLDQPLDSLDPHSFTERYSYELADYGGGSGFGYPVPQVVMDRDTSYSDTAGQVAYATTPYKYHTFTMEWLPHEVRILYDSNVVRRIPDRLIPRNSRYYDWVTTYAREPVNIYPAETDFDNNSNNFDPFGTYSNNDGHGYDYSTTYLERHYFETYGTTCSGCWPFHSKPAAHHLVDYVKIWDLPAGSQIQAFPH